MKTAAQSRGDDTIVNLSSIWDCKQMQAHLVIGNIYCAILNSPYIYKDK